MTQTASLLVELLTEELPPTALKKLGTAFSELLTEQLRQEGYLTPTSQVQPFASPRRLACHITNVLGKSPDVNEQTRLLPAKIGLDNDGNATPPLLKKLTSLGLEGLDLSQLKRINDGKQDMLHVDRVLPGITLEESINSALQQATHKLPIPKVMSYQRPSGETVHFVRPAHRLTVLHGDRLIEAKVLGLTSSNITEGHRFLSPGELTLEHADQYEEQLKDQGKVLASFEKRKVVILNQLQELAKGDCVVQPDELVDEVAALVEWPVTYEAHFEEAFLKVPQECLILTMQANQKYFAVTDSAGKMRNRFLLVSNLATSTPESIISGNERVLRARLADAQFFFEQDQKHSLESRLPLMDKVVYHNKLGSQKDRNTRLVQLAGHLASACRTEAHLAERAALLCKADLRTEMVGEFPELQGIMGEYYAHHDGEPAQVAQAIADHYRPKFAGDELARGEVGLAIALADKLETLVGIYGIGLIPTGEKDPFALRRHALGVIRMMIERNLPLLLSDLLSMTAKLFEGNTHFTDPGKALYGFILDRLKGYLRDQGYSAKEVESVLSQNPQRLADVTARLDAVRGFSNLPQATALAAANKRIGNILKKVEKVPSAFDTKLFSEPAEKDLAIQIQALETQANQAYESGNYAEALAVLAPLKTEVDAFFDGVMVMADDEQVKNNRIALLGHLHGLMNRVANISELAT